MVSRLVSRRICSSASTGEVLRLVDDQDHAQALGIGVEQVVVERVDQRLGAAARALDVEAQLVAIDSSSSTGDCRGLSTSATRVRSGNCSSSRRRQRGLAGADLAGELDEAAAAALADAVEQMRERVAMALATGYTKRGSGVIEKGASRRP